ncbi:MAG: Uma2 family endonuclease [Lachnospiraceae bacterium]|nr:Uma2 family endonuclease [Lachnospiraceae bacterium]
MKNLENMEHRQAESSRPSADREMTLTTEFSELSGKDDFVRETSFEYAHSRMGRYTIEDYYALPDDRRVELIDGVFYDMAAPAVTHQAAISQIFRQLADYIDSEGGSCLPLISPVDVQLDCDDRTMVQPDIMVVCDWSKVINRCIYGAPDLVMEVLSDSTARKDQTIKLEKYRKAGVKEYWMIDLQQEKAVVYDFVNEISPGIYGVNRSVPVGIFEGKCQIRFEKILDTIKRLQE